MKKILLSIGMLLAMNATFAQTKTATPTLNSAPPVVNLQTPAAPASSLKPENMYFAITVHDFGTVQEGPTADHEFEFVNTGKEPIVISNVTASCGCTTPSYSKEPVLPGKKGKIKASYNTQGRVAPFTKSITITSNAGTKVLTIKGEVEKAPTGSVPSNNSLIKTN
jgi:hypothetical protein